MNNTYNRLLNLVTNSDRTDEVSLGWAAKHAEAGFESRGPKSRGRRNDRDNSMTRIRTGLGDRRGMADAPEARTFQHNFLQRRMQRDGYTKPMTPAEELTNKRGGTDPEPQTQRTVVPNRTPRMRRSTSHEEPDIKAKADERKAALVAKSTKRADDVKFHKSQQTRPGRY